MRLDILLRSSMGRKKGAQKRLFQCCLDVNMGLDEVTAVMKNETLLEIHQSPIQVSITRGNLEINLLFDTFDRLFKSHKAM